MGEVVVWVRVVVTGMAITTVNSDNGATASKDEYMLTMTVFMVGGMATTMMMLMTLPS